MNQALAYEVVDCERQGRTFTGVIPAADGAYPVQYFFEVLAEDDAWPYPGLSADLADQPYYVIHHDPDTTWGRP